LLYSASWAIELANSLDVPLESIPQLTHSPLYQTEFVKYSYGKSLYDLKEFRRASHALNDCQSIEGIFLKLYSLYMAGEKIKSDEEIEALSEDPSNKNPFLEQIKTELAERDASNMLDGFGYYLYGIVERELGMKAKARHYFTRACHSNPLIWSAWEDLYKLCDDRNMLNTLSVPDHWMKDFFLAAGSLELLQTNDALSYYSHLSTIGFSASSYIVHQLAMVYYQLRDFPQSAKIFQSLQSVDPHNMNGIDVYSHVLFVMEMLPELYQLAIDADGIDKYRPESCSVIGNFYSLFGDHEKACTYFKRAVQLDKTNHTSWILLGHEYLELKNHSMAIDAYTKASG
jgi:anaphase-promoting complex subunit 8